MTFFETLRIGLVRQVQVLISLSLREIRLRNSRFAFSYLMDVLESIAFIFFIYLLFVFLGRPLPIGDSILLFIATGVLPVLFFRSVSMKSAGSVRALRGARALHNVTLTDAAIARGMVESLTYSVVMILLFSSMAIGNASDYAIPYNPIRAVEALTLLIILGISFGFINSAVASIVPLWQTFWSMFARVQIFLAGVYYIPEYMPTYIMNIISWNPIAHLVAFFRTAFYPTYPQYFIDMEYVGKWIVGSLIIGLALQRVLRNRLAVS